MPDVLSIALPATARGYPDSFIFHRLFSYDDFCRLRMIALIIPVSGIHTSRLFVKRRF